MISFTKAHQIGCIIVGSLSLMVAPLPGSEVDGYTEPYREIDVAASETGTIASLFVEEGDDVAEGQRLGGLDDSVLRATLAVAEQVMNSQGRLRAAFVEFEMQRARFEKIDGLRKRDHASQVELDRVKSEYQTARAQVQTMQEELRVKKLEHGQIQAQLERRQIVSPINGIVTEVIKDRGEFVSGADPVILRIVQLDPLQIVFFVPSELGRDFRRGDEIDIEIGMRRESAKATVVFASPAADAQSGTVRVKMRVPNPGLRRQSGELCRLVLPGTEDLDKPGEESLDGLVQHSRSSNDR